MVKAVLFDTDGMIIKRELRFHDRYAEDFGVQPGILLDFFAHDFQDCLVDKLDLKIELKKHIKAWGWGKSVDELLDYWFEGEKQVDQILIDNIQNLRKKRIKCYLNTNNEKYRAHYLFETLGLAKHFDDSFSSSQLKHKKPEHEFWSLILSKIGNPEKNDIVVWDDDENNVQSAREFGLQAYRYTSYEEYDEQMKLLDSV